MAFDARADDRDTRGFISMTTTSPVARFRANWTLAPPVETPTARMTVIAASRSDWSSWSVSVMTGATVTESPVWTPIGSMFSMEHTITALSATSRTTSSSISAHPSTERSTRTWPIGLAARAVARRASSSSGVCAAPPPSPPRVNAGRRITGRPSWAAAARPPARSVTMWLSGTARPAPSIVSRNTSRSSARRMAGTSAPISSTPYRSSTPDPLSSIARFRAVWPPSVGSSASGRSRAMTASTASGSSGSTYVRSATEGSVMIVAGFELTSTTR